MYALIHGLVTMKYWTHSPTGVVTLVTLCCGDGFADIIGRRFGTIKWPHSKRKSFAGSLAFVVASTVVGVGYMQLFANKACGLMSTAMPLPENPFQHMALVSLIAAAVESLPIDEIDNLTVAIAACISSSLLLRRVR